MQNKNTLLAAGITSTVLLALVLIAHRARQASPVMSSPDELRQMVFRQEEAAIEREIGQRVSANTSLA